MAQKLIVTGGTMTKFGYLVGTAACIGALLFAALPAGADSQHKQLASKPPAAEPAKKAHRVVLQVNSADPAMMNLTLNNASNIEQYYKERGDKVEIEIVTFGPGLHMLREDTSPVKDRIKAMAEKSKAISFKACANTQVNMAKAEKQEIELVPEATIVPSGVVRVMELQEQGWSYVRP
jgi:intracellular sulfur oxidation DsrE/DsrF family protein